MRGFFRKIQNSGSESAETFEELLIGQIGHLYAFAWRLTGDRQAAEDLVQEASLKAFKAFGSLREKSRFKTWIFQILRNLFFDGSPNRTLESLEEVEDAELVEDGEDLLVEQVLLEEIREALDRLPGAFRATLWLSDVEGFTQREIAEILGCSMGTVASRLYRGRALLRKQLMSGRPKRKERTQS